MPVRRRYSLSIRQYWEQNILVFEGKSVFSWVNSWEVSDRFTENGFRAFLSMGAFIPRYGGPAKKWVQQLVLVCSFWASQDKRKEREGCKKRGACQLYSTRALYFHTFTRAYHLRHLALALYVWVWGQTVAFGLVRLCEYVGFFCGQDAHKSNSWNAAKCNAVWDWECGCSWQCFSLLCYIGLFEHAFWGKRLFLWVQLFQVRNHCGSYGWRTGNSDK